VFPCVSFDNFEASYAMVNYLIALGHSDFAILFSHLKNNDRIEACFEGIKKCLRDHGIAPDPDLMAEAGFTIAEGRAPQALLDEGRRHGRGLYRRRAGCGCPIRSAESQHRRAGPAVEGALCILDL
jgi:DNA-binding LacI/PurR family transcriptional regulator